MELDRYDIEQDKKLAEETTALVENYTVRLNSYLALYSLTTSLLYSSQMAE